MTTRATKIRAYNLEAMAKRKRLKQEREESNLLLSEFLSVMSKLCLNPGNRELERELEDIKIAQLVSDKVVMKLKKDCDRAEHELSRFISVGL